MQETFVMLFRALRVYQWTKNLLVFAAIVFAQQLFVWNQLWRSVLAFISFCAASSAMYLFNDIMDVGKDRIHPEKCTRPIASGALKIPMAYGLVVILLGIAMGIGYDINLKFFMILMAYMALIVSYSVGLKNVIIVDVLVLAVGFVIRAMAGAIALSVAFSNWLVVCTLFLALFLGLSKRRHEIKLLNHEAISHREVLGHYTIGYLDAANLIVAGATLITYTIYTCSPEVVSRLGTDKLYLTLPFVVYGLLRYLYLVHHNVDGGDPSSTLVRDRSLGIAVVLWGIACLVIIYWKIV